MQGNDWTLADFVARPTDTALWGSGPLLVVRPLKNPDSATDPDEGTFVFDTPARTNLSSSGDHMTVGGVGDYLLPNSLVVPVLKTGRNPFTLVSVGRARNNDVVLPDRSVSKVHAYFVPPVSAGALWGLKDTGSSNGTHLVLSSGLRRIGEEAVPVDHGTEIKFGVVRCLLTDQETLQHAALWASHSWKKA